MRIWCDWKPEGEAAGLLRSGAGQAEIVFKAHGAPVADADIAVGQPDPAEIIAADRPKWIHITSAGYTKFDRSDFWQAIKSRGGAVTNSSSVFAEPCAQHVLAMMMAFARGLPWAAENQFLNRGWQQHALREHATLTLGQKVLIYGFGAIGQRLAAMLAPLQMEVIGVRRSPRGHEALKVLSIDAAENELPTADHVVNLLPLNDSTDNFFAPARFARMKRGALFYNIGRGKTVDQPALIAALQSGTLAAAYLDVTEPEPLPRDHPLWKTSNCFITPHSAGGHKGEVKRVVEHFLGNLRHWERNEPLTDRIA